MRARYLCVVVVAVLAVTACSSSSPQLAAEAAPLGPAMASQGTIADYESFPGGGSFVGLTEYIGSPLSGGQQRRVVLGLFTAAREGHTYANTPEGLPGPTEFEFRDPDADQYFGRFDTVLLDFEATELFAGHSDATTGMITVAIQVPPNVTLADVRAEYVTKARTVLWLEPSWVYRDRNEPDIWAPMHGGRYVGIVREDNTLRFPMIDTPPRLHETVTLDDLRAAA